jgi:hypothetical protein
MTEDRDCTKVNFTWNPFVRERLDFSFEEEPAEKSATVEDVQRLEEKIDSLTRKIDLIFGDHVMINGRIYQLGELAKERTEEG